MRQIYKNNLTILILLFSFFPVRLAYLIYLFSRPIIIVRPPKRVEIFDSEGNLLATSMQTYSVYCLPLELSQDNRLAAKDLSSILGLKSSHIKRRFYVNSRFVWIARHITPEKANKIASLGYSGIYITKDYIRFYPLGDLFFHILGKVDDQNQGLIGVEKYYNDYLNDEKNPPLKLSLKSSFQHILKDEVLKGKEKFNAKSVSGMIICAKTGKLLAVFSKYDNSTFSNPHIRDSRTELNLVFQGRYELGSIMKAISASMFLEHGLVTNNTKLQVPPYYFIGSHKIRDYGKEHLDEITLTFQEAFSFSSNVSFVMLANENLDLATQRKYYTHLGLFDDLYIDNIFVKRPLYPKFMRRCDISVFSYGYGVSLSLASYMLGFLRVVTGKNLSLHIEEDFIPSVYENEPLISKSTVKNILLLLRETIKKHEKDYAFKGVKVGGKTGTAKRHSLVGYKDNSNLSSYVFVFPIHKPKYVGIILIDDPKLNDVALYGYQSAMKIALSIVERLLKC